MHALLLSMLLASGPATAASWSDFADIFPALPCHDGWAGCVVDGQDLDPDMVQGSDALPQPAALRLDWFSLEAAPAFSPFVGLSDYPTKLTQVASGPRRPDRSSGDRPGPGPGPAAADSPGHTAPGPGARTDRTAGPVAHDGTADAGTTHTTSHTTSTSDHGSTTTHQATSYDQPSTSDPVATTDHQPDPGQTDPVVVETTSNDAVAMVTPVVEINDSCDDLVALEPAALMGQLTPGQCECLEARIVSTSRMTEKDKVSRVLIMDSETKGDRKGWETLMKRHLEEIDRSDPDLCFKYAIYLSRKGVGRAHGVVRWSDYALENKSKWKGNTFVSRVYALLKLKAEAANRIWQAAEEAYVADRTDANEAKATKYRDLTKVYAREWLDYARASGQEIKNASALCVSSAGSRQY